jgi:hypothetical protein
MYPRAGLDDMEKRKFFTRDSNSEPLVVQAEASRYTNYAIPDPRDITNSF